MIIDLVYGVLGRARKEFRARLKVTGVRSSMGRVESCFDNVMAVSFFATLECELGRSAFHTHAEAVREIFDLIGGWQDLHRRHSAPIRLSPISYEQSQARHKGKVCTVDVDLAIEED